MGHSAGAHIALMLAANTPYLAQAGVDRTEDARRDRPSGPYDFLPLKSAEADRHLRRRQQPQIEAITFANAPLPPALLIHGTADTTVYPRNSENLAAAWRAAGAPVELKLYPEVGHIDMVAAFSDLLHKRATTREDVLAYIDAS
jgi:dipeptidyl aminopeptidase/acylaminoacyl peptidase